MFSSMMTSHKDFPSNNLMCGSVMDDGMASELLTARRTLEIALGVVRHYHVGVTLNERSGIFLFVTVKQTLALSAVHRDCVCFSRITS